MARRPYQLDLIINGTLQQFLTTRSTWRKDELIAAVMSTRGVRPIMRRIHDELALADLDIVLVQGITKRVGDLLHSRDRFGIRKYECYRPTGQTKWLWFPLRYATSDRLLVVMQHARYQSRALQVKARAYQKFYDELKRRPRGTLLDSIYDDVAPLVQSRMAA